MKLISKKITVILIYFISFTFGYFFSKHQLRDLVDRQPSYSVYDQQWIQEGQACKFDWQCSDNLSCISRICQSRANKLSYGDMCSNPFQCQSGQCQFGKCQGGNRTTPVGEACNYASDCISGLCGPLHGKRICFSSDSLPGFYGDPCVSPSSCLSNICDNQTCQPSKNFFNCLAVDEVASNEYECCSNQWDNLTHRCKATGDQECSLKSNCRGRSGRTCGLIETKVDYNNQCCSLNSVHQGDNRVCVFSNNINIQPCNQDSHCNYPKICDKKRQICK